MSEILVKPLLFDSGTPVADAMLQDCLVCYIVLFNMHRLAN